MVDFKVTAGDVTVGGESKFKIVIHDSNGNDVCVVCEDNLNEMIDVGIKLSEDLLMALTTALEIYKGEK